MGDKGDCPIGRGKSPLHSTQFEKRTERWLGSYQGKVGPCSTKMPRSEIIYSSTLDENFRSPLSRKWFRRSSFNRLYCPICKLLTSLSSATNSIMPYLEINATQFSTG